MNIELTEDEARSLLEIIPASISHARQAMYHYEQVNDPIQSDQDNYEYYNNLYWKLLAIREKVNTMLAAATRRTLQTEAEREELTT